MTIELKPVWVVQYHGEEIINGFGIELSIKTNDYASASKQWIWMKEGETDFRESKWDYKFFTNIEGAEKQLLIEKAAKIESIEKQIKSQQEQVEKLKNS